MPMAMPKAHRVLLYLVVAAAELVVRIDWGLSFVHSSS